MNMKNALRQYESFERHEAALKMKAWDDDLKKQIETMGIDELKLQIAKYKAERDNLKHEGQTIVEMVQIVAQETRLIKIDTALKNKLIILTTGLDPRFFWLIYEINAKKENFRAMQKRAGKYHYRCETCHEEVKGWTWQFGQKHFYICPECWKKYIDSTESPLKKVQFDPIDEKAHASCLTTGV